MALRDETKYTMKSLWDGLLPDLDMHGDWLRLDNSEDYTISFGVPCFLMSRPRAIRAIKGMVADLSAKIYGSLYGGNPFFYFPRDKQSEPKR